MTQKRSSIPVLFFPDPIHFIYYAEIVLKSPLAIYYKLCFTPAPPPSQIPKPVDIFLLHLRVEGDRQGGLIRLSVVHDPLAEHVRVSRVEKEVP